MLINNPKIDINQVDNILNQVNILLCFFVLIMKWRFIYGVIFQTPLHKAAKGGNIEIVKLLINIPTIQIQIKDVLILNFVFLMVNVLYFMHELVNMMKLRKYY